MREPGVRGRRRQFRQGSIPLLWVRLVSGATWMVRLGVVSRVRHPVASSGFRAEGDGAGGFLPALDLVPVVLRSAFQPAVPAGDPGVGSPAAEFGAAAAVDAGQFGHANTSPCCGVMLDPVGWAAGPLAGCF